ncbi:hypothetical protein GUJ93_ZPchr0008g12703 [Zizania palustris]|uniref:Protein PHYTOCHROME KINASE SUBSTRATE 4 n=1 Tax=Zizania palustris TaxID=103762 RepID=A0A8J5RFP2_ZIZPA|nr:hypothetical protein GUJ93_ZPchr0008g12703 [Zizania palustris]
MDRYRVAPRPIYLSGAAGGEHDGPGRLHLQPLRAGSARSGRRSGGAELDIFSAERYFNADDVVKKCGGDGGVAALPSADEPRREELAVLASQSGRTVASSEASWNSRSELLSSHCQFAAVDKVNKGGGGNGVAAASGQHCQRSKKLVPGQRRGLFSRVCPCAGRKAVTVDVASEPRSPVTPKIHTRFDADHVVADSTIFKAKALPPTPCEEVELVKMKISPGSSRFQPPASNIFATAPSRAGNAPFAAFPLDTGRRVVSSGGFMFPVVGAPKVVSTMDELPRESLEVFRPIFEESVLADPPADLAVGGGGLAAGFARTPGVAAVAMDEEAMSDASSDLFDLDSFAASSSYLTTHRGRSSRRNSRDDDLPYAAESTLSECMYAPSEVSVVWSVATAEGGAFDAASMANFSSAASACCVEEFSFVPPGAVAVAGRVKRGGGGGLLNSCRGEKAVSVGPTPVRVVRPLAAGPEVPVKTGGHAMGLNSGGSARYHPAGRVHVPVWT